MAISETAQKNHEEQFPNHHSGCPCRLGKMQKLHKTMYQPGCVDSESKNSVIRL